jgi:hypothetical protein
MAGQDTLGDKGYQGHATIHPIRKQPEAEMTVHDQHVSPCVPQIIEVRRCLESLDASSERCCLVETAKSPSDTV